MFNIAENTKVVNVAAPADFSGGAMTTEWISMENATKATFLLSIGALSASSAVITLNVADDITPTHSATAAASMDLPFEYYYKSGALPSDTFTKTTVSSSTFTLSKSTDDNRVLAIEVKAAEMGQFTDTSVYDAKYVRLAMANPSASCFGSCVCILTGLRYQSDSPPTAIL